MKLIGPWFSPFTRRVGITLNLLELPYEHVPLHAFAQKDELRPFNPMTRVPVLQLDSGERLVDSSAIADYLDELVGPKRALTPPSGPIRRTVLQVVGYASAVVEKASSVYLETLRPPASQSSTIASGNTQQALCGLELLEQRIDGPFVVGSRVTQADIMTVVAYQTALFVLGREVAGDPRLSAHAQRMMSDSRVASTMPTAP